MSACDTLVAIKVDPEGYYLAQTLKHYNAFNTILYIISLDSIAFDLKQNALVPRAPQRPFWQWPLPCCCTFRLEDAKEVRRLVGGQSHLCNPTFARILLLPEEVFFLPHPKIGAMMLWEGEMEQFGSAVDITVLQHQFIKDTLKLNILDGTRKKNGGGAHFVSILRLHLCNHVQHHALDCLRSIVQRLSFAPLAHHLKKPVLTIHVSVSY